MGRRRATPVRRRRQVWSLGLVGLAAFGGAVGLLVGLGPSDDPDPEAGLVGRLAVDGEPVDVIECVLRLAGDDVALGRLAGGAVDELVATCRSARASLDGPVAPPVDALASVDPGPWTLGDDPAFDRLWTDCAAGVGSACDRLFERAPVDSDYERYGLSCGERPDVLDCAELDQPAADPDADPDDDPAGARARRAPPVDGDRTGDLEPSPEPRTSTFPR